jgi:hypothetical protein
VGTSFDEVSELTSSLLQHYGPGVDPTSKKNEYQKFYLGNRARQARKADNLTAICEPIV